MKIDTSTSVELSEIEVRNAIRNYLLSIGVNDVPGDASIDTVNQLGDPVTSLVARYNTSSN